MPLQLLIAPPAAGKTRYCIQQIQAPRPLGRAWVLVRDRLQAAEFRRRLAEAGGALGVRVETFQNLYAEILLRAGGPARPLAEPALRYQLARQAVQASPLDYFAPLRELPGFALSMARRMAELQRALVPPARLRVPEAGRTLAELGLVYQGYRDTLEAAGWDDLESAAWRALEALERDPDLLADLDLLVVDGFDWLDPAQRDTVRRIAGRGMRVLVTLPGRPGLRRAVERGFARLAGDLQRESEVELLTLPDPPRLPDALAHLEANLLAGAPPREEAGPGLELIEARSPAEESREALRWLKRRLLREDPGLRCALLVPEPEAYEPALRAAAAEFGLPLRFSHTRRLEDAPLVAALLNLLGLARAGYPRQALLDALRSPFFDLAPLGLDRAAVDQLDQISRESIVIEGLEHWREAFRSLAAAQEGEPFLEGEDGAWLPRVPTGPAAARLAAAFEAFAGQVSPPAEARDLPGWLAWLETLLENLGFAPGGASESPAERAALLGLNGCLEGMLAADAVLNPPGARLLDYLAFLDELEAGIGGSGWAEEVPAGVNEIQVLRVLEARGLRFDLVAILGLSEGGFPRVLRPDPLFAEEDRRELGVEPRLEQDQLGSFYQALARADQALLLTRPYMAESGDTWEPSPYWEAVRALYPACVRRIRPDDPLALGEAASLGELLFWAARRSAVTGQSLPESFSADLQARFAVLGQAQERLAALTAGQEAHEPELGELAVLRLDGGRAWSVSRLEAYAACPFRFYVDTVLQVEPHAAPGWDLDVALLGSLLHKVLERIYTRAANPADPASVLQNLEEVAGAVFAEAEAQHGFRASPLWAEARLELLERVRETVLGLSDPEEGWLPLAFEQRFGFSDQPPLEVTVDGATVRLHGVIDRIDRARDGRLRVVDYKTGGSHLAKSDLVEGRRLQLPVYALAAEQSLGLGEAAEGFYWRIGKDGDQSSLHLSSFSSGPYRGPRGAVELAVEHIQNLAGRIAALEFPPDPLGGKCPSYCSAAAWCWRYEPERQP